MARAKPVPQVDPGQLLETITLVYGWADPEGDDEANDWLEGDEVFDILGRITRALEVETPTAVALFQRSLALFSYCATSELSNVFFEGGFPGRELCIAASKAPVLNQCGPEQGELCPYFDTDGLRAAFRAALN